MKPGQGKNKGGAFEREVCKKLSLWISSGQYEDVFWRSAISGGRYTQARKRGKVLGAQAGDLSAVRPEGNMFIERFVVECKFYKDLNFKGLIFPTVTKGLPEFWHKVKKQAKELHKYPMLIAKQNKMKPVVLLAKDGGLDQFSWGNSRWSTAPVTAHFKLHDAHVMLLDDFLDRAHILGILI